MRVSAPSHGPDLREILKDNPRFHRLADIHSELSDELTSWATRMEVLLAIQAFLKPGMSTLETGCGQSTVMFAAANTNHWCVTPARGETERVLEFCVAQNLSTSRLHFLVGDSQDVLPELDPMLNLHLVLIDGGHFFPIPCFDWYYAGARLVSGGVLVLDDVRIPTVRILFEFLRADANWHLVRLIDDTAFFRKIRHAANLHDWIEQTYNSTYPDWSFLPWTQRLHRAAESAWTTAVRRAARGWIRMRRLPRRQR